MVKSLKQSKNKGLTLKNKLKLSLNNFMERKRNLLIATATSIGFIGVLISFGLGNAIVGMINDSTDGGNIPSQIQISLRAKSAARGVLNADDEKFIRNQIKSDDIKYLESPFGMNMASLTLDGKTMDFSKDLPNYSQVISLYKNTKISTSRNDKDKISAGSLFKSKKMKRATFPMSFVKRYNQETGKKLKAKDFIGKEISAQIVENTADGTKVADIKTKIVRIVDDSEDAEESNSYMPAKQLEELLKENGFTKTVSYMLWSSRIQPRLRKSLKNCRKTRSICFFHSRPS